jgi:hypothetical protein
MQADTYEKYLTSSPTLEVIADEDLAVGDIVRLAITTDGSRLRAFPALATTLAAGAGHVLFQVHRPGNANQTCEVSLYRATAIVGAPGAVGDPLYLTDAGGLSAVDTATVSRVVGYRITNGYFFCGTP